MIGLPKISADHSKQSSPIGFRAACIFLKGDWAEFVNALGFCGWADAHAPCAFCKTTLADMYQTKGFTPFRTPAPPNTLDDYFAACHACEKTVEVSPSDMRKLRPNFFYDKRGAKSYMGPRAGRERAGAWA